MRGRTWELKFLLLCDASCRNIMRTGVGSYKELYKYSSLQTKKVKKCAKQLEHGSGWNLTIAESGSWVRFANGDCLIGVGGWVVGRGSWVVGPRLQLTDFPCTLTFNVNNNSDLRMSNSPAYPPWRRLLLQGFWQTRAFQLFLTNHTWAFRRYQRNNGTISTRRMHDGWSLAFMKSINHDQTWRQKSHEMFARKWLKSSVAAMTQLFRVSQK